MKRFRVISLLILTGLCTAGIAKAQNGTIRANVPFDFAVGSKLLPSGSYQFFTSSAQSNHTIFIRSADQQIIMLGMTGEDSNLPGNVTRLVFYKYGDHCVSRRRQQPYRCRRTKQEMRVGPSVAAIRSRHQTTACCCR
jgi:hypothetical protein